MPRIDNMTLVPGETVLRRMRPHWITLILPVFSFIVLTIMYTWLLGLIGNLNEPFRNILQWVVGLIVLALFLRWVVKTFIWWATTKYLFTNKRIVTRTGLIRVEGESIALNKIQSIQFEKTLLERIFGSGSLIVESAAENRITIVYVWDAEKIQQQVYEQINKLEQENTKDNSL